MDAVFHKGSRWEDKSSKRHDAAAFVEATTSRQCSSATPRKPLPASCQWRRGLIRIDGNLSTTGKFADEDSDYSSRRLTTTSSRKRILSRRGVKGARQPPGISVSDRRGFECAADWTISTARYNFSGSSLNLSLDSSLYIRSCQVPRLAAIGCAIGVVGPD